jgi:hypothetical protein
VHRFWWQHTTLQDNRLRPGDHLIQINGINLHGMSSQQVAMILRQQDTSRGVRLTVARPLPTMAAPAQPGDRSDRGCFQMPTKSVLDPVVFDAYCNEHAQQFVPAPDTHVEDATQTVITSVAEESTTGIADDAITTHAKNDAPTTADQQVPKQTSVDVPPTDGDLTPPSDVAIPVAMDNNEVRHCFSWTH